MTNFEITLDEFDKEWHEFRKAAKAVRKAGERASWLLKTSSGIMALSIFVWIFQKNDSFWIEAAIAFFGVAIWVAGDFSALATESRFENGAKELEVKFINSWKNYLTIVRGDVLKKMEKLPEPWRSKEIELEAVAAREAEFEESASSWTTWFKVIDSIYEALEMANETLDSESQGQKLKSFIKKCGVLTKIFKNTKKAFGVARALISMIDSMAIVMMLLAPFFSFERFASLGIFWLAFSFVFSRASFMLERRYDEWFDERFKQIRIDHGKMALEMANRLNKDAVAKEFSEFFLGVESQTETFGMLKAFALFKKEWLE